MTERSPEEQNHRVAELEQMLRESRHKAEIQHADYLECLNKNAKLEMKLRMVQNENETLKRALIVSEEKGFEEALEMIEINLVDSKESNQIRAESAARAREIRLEMKIPRKLR